MELECLNDLLTVCKISDLSVINPEDDLFFLGKTDEEISLVCRTENTPAHTVAREDGWRGFRIRGILDFSLTGVLSRITGVLADNRIGVFAVSTYNTDYILVKEENTDRAVNALENAGYRIVPETKN